MVSLGHVVAGNEDIFNGEVKLILGLIWALILKYQISRRQSLLPSGAGGGSGVKDAMRAWLREVLPEHIDVSRINFTRDWNDGTLLLALIEALQPGAVGDQAASVADSDLERCRLALNIAQQQLGVPQLLHAADLANPAVDERSVLTYLSFFADIDENAQEDDAEDLLAWTKEKLVEMPITNFDSDWHNGIALCALVNKLCPGACPDWQELDPENGEENFQLAIDLAREHLDVDLEVAAEEIIQSGTGSELGFLPLIAELQVAGQEIEDCRLCAALGPGLAEAKVGKRAEFSIRHLNPAEQIGIEIVGPDNEVIAGQIVDNPDEKGVLSVQYTPLQPGSYGISVLCHGRHILNSPFEVIVDGGSDPLLCRVEGLVDKPALVNTEQEFVFDGQQGGIGEPMVLLQDLLSSPATITKEPGDERMFRVRYTPMEVGRLTVMALWNSEPIAGSPFGVNVFDPKKCVAEGEGLKNACAGQKTIFTLDARTAGPGELTVQFSGVATQGEAKIEPSAEDPAILVVEYVPKAVGKLGITLLWNGLPVTDKPFTSKVVKPRYTGGVALSRKSLFKKLTLGSQVKLEAELSGGTVAGKAKNLTAKARGLKSGTVPVVVKIDSGSQFQIEMKPKLADEYFIDVLLDDKPIDGSPLRAVFANPCNPDAVMVSGPETGLVAQEVRFSVDSSAAGSGELEVHVTGPAAHGDLAVSVQPGSKPAENYICYTPNAAGRHHVAIKWAGQPVPGSPFPLNVDMPTVDASQVKIHCEKELMEALPLGEPLVMVFDTSEAGIDEFSAMAVSESTLQSHDLMVVNEDDDLYTLTFEPPLPAKYQLYIFYGEDQVPGSPFSLMAVTGAGDVEIESVRFGDVGEPVLVGLRLADYEKANSAAVTVMTPDQSQSEVVKDVSLTTDGLYVASFVPTLSGPHHFEVLWDGAPIAGGTFDVDVTPSRPPKPSPTFKREQSVKDESSRSQGSSPGPGTRRETPLTKEDSVAEGSPRRVARQRGSSVRVMKRLPERISLGERTTVAFQAPGVQTSTIVAKLTDPAGKLIPVEVLTSSVGLYTVNLTPRSSGQHTLDVTVAGRHIPESPFSFSAISDGSSPAGNRKAPDAQRCTLSHVPSSVFVGKTCHFIVSTHNAGVAELDVTVANGPLRQTDISISKPRAHVFSVQLAPWLPGNVSLNATWGGQPIPGSPVCISFMDCTPDASKCHANAESPLVIATNRWQRVRCRAVQAHNLTQTEFSFTK